MTRFRLRLSSILWLVALVAAFLGGVRYWQDRAVTRAEALYRFLVLSPSEVDKSFASPKMRTPSIKAETVP